MVVMVTLHQENDVGKQCDVDGAELGPTQSPVEPSVIQQPVLGHYQVL